MRYLPIFLLLALASFPASAKLFKWVDEKGVTHYGDSIPPQYAKQGNEELSKKGLVIKKTDAPATPEQLKAKEEEAEKKKVEEKQALEQKRRDKALLNTYTNEKEIDLVRDRNLQQGSLQLQSMDLRMKQVQPRHAEAQKKAEGFTAKGKPVPPYLQQELQETDKEMARMQEMIKQKNKEMDEIRAKFEDDKKRFRELRQIEDSAKK